MSGGSDTWAGRQGTGRPEAGGPYGDISPDISGETSRGFPDISGETLGDTSRDTYGDIFPDISRETSRGCIQEYIREAGSDDLNNAILGRTSVGFS